MKELERIYEALGVPETSPWPNSKTWTRLKDALERIEYLEECEDYCNSYR